MVLHYRMSILFVKPKIKIELDQSVHKSSHLTHFTTIAVVVQVIKLGEIFSLDGAPYPSV
jgi:hypothetical protein